MIPTEEEVPEKKYRVRHCGPEEFIIEQRFVRKQVATWRWLNFQGKVYGTCHHYPTLKEAIARIDAFKRVEYGGIVYQDPA